MNASLSFLPQINGVQTERLDLDDSFVQVAGRFSHIPGTVALISGTDLDCARYSILAVKPWLTVLGTRSGLEIRLSGEPSVQLAGDPLDLVGDLLNRFNLDSVGEHGLPVTAGLFGYLSYDVKDMIEALPRTCLSTGLPDIYLCAPSLILVQDRKSGSIHRCIPDIVWGENTDAWSYETTVDFFEKTMAAPGQPENDQGRFAIDGRGFRSNFTKAAYMEAVEKIIDYIRAGDIYQVNLSQRFETGFEGDAYGLFLKLFQKNPAPFFAYVNAGDHQIVSTSPERFIQRQGNRIETRPIKGTLPRGGTREEDRELGKALLESLKDDAELSMIVDLMRNDLGRVARGGSVRVREHKRLEPYDNVFHLVSIVEAELAHGKSSMDLIRATFPGGSITGCPKIRSMEIIDELEPMKRHVYTGSIGYISFHDSLDLSIAIRTATVHRNRISFSVGGGIVYDSEPEKEYHETLHKGKTLLETITRHGREASAGRSIAWINGVLVPEDEAVVPAQGPAFFYGAGLFETIRCENGIPKRLDRHIERFNAGWRSLFFQEPPDITWDSVIDHLIRENGLAREVGAVKIVGGTAPEDGGADRPVLAAFARPYRHRLSVIGRPGLDLVTYPFPRQTPLADFKTLNYLYYYRAGLYAREKGVHEALILNPDGTVSETNTCAVLVVGETSVTVPVSEHVLPSVSQAEVIQALEKAGWTIVREPLKPMDLATRGTVILTNALMGAVPVLSLDGKPLDDAFQETAMINGLLGFQGIPS